MIFNTFSLSLSCPIFHFNLAIQHSVLYLISTNEMRKNIFGTLKIEKSGEIWFSIFKEIQNSITPKISHG